MPESNAAHPSEAPLLDSQPGLGSQRYLQLFESLTPLIGCHDRDEICRRACELIAQLLDVGACSLMLLDPESDRLCMAAATHIPQTEWPSIRQPKEEGICGRALRTGQVLTIQGEEHFREQFGRFSESRYQTAACVVAPLRIQGGQGGVINVARPRERRSFVQRDLDLIRAVGHLIASALDSAMQYDQSIRLQRDLKNIFDNLSVGVLAVDPRERVTHGNQRACQMFGFDHRDAPALASALPVEVYKSCKELMSKAGERNPPVGEIVRYEHNGSRQALQVLATRLTGHLFDEFLITILDVGQEEEVRRLRESESMKMCFLSIISHELRTPLTVIRSALPMIDPKPGAEVSPQILAQVHRLMSNNCHRLSEVVNAILDVTEIEAGTLQLAPRPSSLHRLIEENLKRYEVGLAEKKLTLDTQFAEDAPEIEFDRKRMGTIFSELMNNAVKFSHPGKTIRIRTRVDESWMELEITNEGQPITDEHRREIFQKFYQANQTMTRSVGGCGLGLYLVSSLVRLHGGRIEVAEPDGNDTTFRVRLPLECAGSEALRPTATADAPEGRAPR